MSEEWQAYVKDPRTVCKYGTKCYQKNPDHRKSYKHPPVNLKKKGNNNHNSPANKRFKASPRPKTPNKDEKCEKPALVDEEVKNDVSPHKQGESGELNDNNASTSSISNEENCRFEIPEILLYHKKDDHNLFKELFFVEMPKDFFDFYKCLEAEQDFEKILKSVNLQLIGPFELLLGRLPILNEKELYLIHWRFFYDPPEFQAILKKAGKSEYHIGYFRDDPESSPVFLAASDSAKGCHITPVADNIFAAVYLYLQNEKKVNLFTSAACQRLMEKVEKWAETHGYSLGEYNMKTRLMQSVTKTFHGAGIVVPYDKKTELGYRKLVETDVNIKKLFAKLESAKTKTERDKLLSELQPVITYAIIAVDEGDFGTGLEVGINLFCSGLKVLEQSALSSLKSVYTLLNRQAFGKIIEVHIKYRRKGPNMSVLSGSE